MSAVKSKLDDIVAKCFQQIPAQVERGFKQVGKFVLSNGQLDYELTEAHKEKGLYAFVIDSEVKLAEGLERRLYGYKNPGRSQKTNLRLQPKLLESLKSGKQPEIWFFSMNHLEPELIQSLQPSWNQALKKKG